jgi:proline iminopeptidase
VSDPGTDSGKRPIEDGIVRATGHGIYHESFGKQKKGTLLAVHDGPGLSSLHLRSLADLAQFGYRVVIYDQWGGGRSERPNDYRDLTFRHLVQEVEGVRRALGLGRPHLLGYGNGGAVAVEAALQHPQSWESLVLSSPSIVIPETRAIFVKMVSRLPTLAREFWQRQDPTMGDLKDPRWREGYRLFEQLRMCRLRVAPYELVTSNENLNVKANDAVMASMRDYDGPSKGYDVTPRLGTLRLPCLITVGRHDMCTPAYARALSHRIPGSQVVIFERSAHAANWEERERYILKLLRFLENVSRGRARDG